jgi:hypothetical protein
MSDLPAVVHEDDHHVQHLKCGADHDEHIDGSDRPSMFNCKKVRQLGDGGRGGRTMYLATAVWPMRIPSLRRSPWMRGAPQSGLLH